MHDKVSILALQCLVCLITRKANMFLFYLPGVYFGNWKWELRAWRLIYWGTWGWKV